MIGSHNFNEFHLKEQGNTYHWKKLQNIEIMEIHIKQEVKCVAEDRFNHGANGDTHNAKKRWEYREHSRLKTSPFFILFLFLDRQQKHELHISFVL